MLKLLLLDSKMIDFNNIFKISTKISEIVFSTFSYYVSIIDNLFIISVVKEPRISDRALAEDLFPADYDMIRGMMTPVRWAPPETIEDPIQRRK